MKHAHPIRIATQLVLATSATWLLAACASTPMPKEQMANAILQVITSGTVHLVPDLLQE